MSKSRTSRKALTAEKIAAREAKERVTLARDIGVPDAQIANRGLATHPTYDSDTGKKIGKTIRILYPTVVDRWLADGGPGFEEPQRRAVEHCRALWASIGTQRQVANYGGTIGGGGDGENQHFALCQLAEYKREIPVAYWSVFENVVRFDMPAGTAGSHLARNSAQQQAHAKSCVGFVASLIAQWRGY